MAHGKTKARATAQQSSVQQRNVQQRTTQLYLDRERFNNALRARGFKTLGQFVQAAGIHRNSISQYLNGEKGVFADLFVRICSELQISNPLTVLTKSLEDGGSLSENRLKQILEPLSNRYSQVAFLLIGSRATGVAKRYSDWDIGLTAGEHELSSDDYLTMKSEIEDLTDNYSESCDVLNLDAAPTWFLENLDYPLVFLVGNAQSFSFIAGTIHGIRKAEKDQQRTRAA